MGSPPRRVKVRAVKDANGVVWVDLFGAKPDDKEVKAKPTEKPKVDKKAEKVEAEKVKEEAKKPLSDAEKKVEKEALKADMKK